MQPCQIVAALSGSGFVTRLHWDGVWDAGKVLEMLALDHDALFLALHHWDGKITTVIDINIIWDLT